MLGVLALPGLPPRAPAPAPAELPAGAARLLYGVPLDLNGAPPEALEALPGIGPARAAAIAAARAERPFCAVSEVVRVYGIGPATLARIAAWVAVDPPLGCPAPAPRAAGEGGGLSSRDSGAPRLVRREVGHDRPVRTRAELRRGQPLEP